MKDRTRAIDGISRRTLLKASAVGVGTSLAGCTAIVPGDTAEDDVPEGVAAPELDLDTLQADTPKGTMQAEAWENTYVGAVNDDLFIGISLSDGINAGEPQEAKVYLCDGEEISERLNGEVGGETTTLEGEELGVELSLADDAVSGAVILNGEEPQPFTANEASGDAGVYAAEGTFDDTDYWGGWVVLPDGSQRGRVDEEEEELQM